MGGKREDSFHQLNMILDSKHRLICDDFNFILQRRRKRAKRSKSSEWQNVGYWQDLGQALQAYSNGVKRESLPKYSRRASAAPARSEHANKAHWRAMREPVGEGKLDTAICWAYYLEPR